MNSRNEAYLLFTIKDEDGNTVRKIKTDPKKGVNRITWDFRYNTFTPIRLNHLMIQFRGKNQIEVIWLYPAIITFH